MMSYLCVSRSAYVTVMMFCLMGVRSSELTRGGVAPDVYRATNTCRARTEETHEALLFMKLHDVIYEI